MDPKDKQLYEAVNRKDLLAILDLCAYWRNVGRLQHRTLHEFEAFVDWLIWGEREYFGPFKERTKQDYLPIIQKYSRPEHEPHDLLGYANAFLEYWYEQIQEEALDLVV